MEVPDGPRNRAWTEERASFAVCFAVWYLLQVFFILLNVHRHVCSSKVPSGICIKFVWIEVGEIRGSIRVAHPL